MSQSDERMVTGREANNGELFEYPVVGMMETKAIDI